MKLDTRRLESAIRTRGVVDFVVRTNAFTRYDVEAWLIEEGSFISLDFCFLLPFGKGEVLSLGGLVLAVLDDVVMDVFGQAPVGDRLARVEFVDGVGAGRADVFDRSVVVVFVT